MDGNADMNLSMHPLWLVGFRPFFALACFSGLALPLLWVLIYRGLLPAPDTSFAAVQWHAHEMFFGFGWAVLGGFLLTATKNWVQVRGYHGGMAAFGRTRLFVQSFLDARKGGAHSGSAGLCGAASGGESWH